MKDESRQPNNYLKKTQIKNFQFLKIPHAMQNLEVETFELFLTDSIMGG